MIELRGITKAFGGQEVLRGVSAVLPGSGLVALRGGSGSGKTTLLRIIAGLESADGGEILGLEDKRVAYVFQEDRLLPHATALENVAIACDKNGARQWLERFGLGASLNKKPAALSGGMRRRVAIARAFAFAGTDSRTVKRGRKHSGFINSSARDSSGVAGGGDVVLLDEPFTGLDADNIGAIAKETARFAKNGLVILVHHGGDILPPDGEITLL